MTKKGFTLVELMIVVAIIGILAAVAIPAYGYYIRRARRAEAAEMLQNVLAAAQQYHNDYRAYPPQVNLVPLTKYGVEGNGKYTTIEPSSPDSNGNCTYYARSCEKAPCSSTTEDYECYQSTARGSAMVCHEVIH